MITVPINVYHPAYTWHLDLLDYVHQRVYGSLYKEKLYSVLIQQYTGLLEFNRGLKYKLSKPWYHDHGLRERLQSMEPGLCVPLNIQTGLRDIINEFCDDAVVELLDHDMFHFRPHPAIDVAEDEFLVCDLYENWHLHSRSTHKGVVDNLVADNSMKFYNGGFVPIIGRVSAFKKILNDWIDMHVEILTKEPRVSNLIGWWAGMYSFNAACERNRIRMTATNYCYIPNLNTLTDEMYIAHYSSDPIFDKRKFPDIDVNTFPDNVFYNTVKSWLESR